MEIFFFINFHPPAREKLKAFIENFLRGYP